MLTLLHFPQWQGGATVRHIPTASAHLCAHFLKQFNTSLSVIEAPILSDTDETIESNIAYRSTVLTQLQDALKLVREAAAAKIVTVGGDCGVETVPIGYLNARANGRMAVVWIDAHGDLNTPESSPSKHYHGMVLRTLCGEGDPEFVACAEKTLHPDQVFLVGVRDLDAPEQQYIDARGVFCTVGFDVEKLNQTIRNRGYSQVYLHFDLDGLNPEIFPHMNYPTAGGLTIEQIADAFETLRQQFDIVGASITEYGSETGEGLTLLDPILAQVALIRQD